jgi:quercetin dioxygenase-like cupin family protein
MRSMAAGLIFLAGLTLAASAVAQSGPPPAATPPAVIAAGKLASVTDAQRYFKVVSVTLASGAKSRVSGPDGILYQTSGSTNVTLNGEIKTLNAGDAIYLPEGTAAQIQAGNAAPSVLFHFMLVRVANVNERAETAPAMVKELYRTAVPLLDLKPGPYDINLTRATFAPQMKLTPPHHRSGAALYYILSGTGMNLIDGNTFMRGPGTFVFEPYSLVHQWSNPSDEVVTRLVFNINPEGVAAVVQTPP